jgi:hypothetical protein
LYAFVVERISVLLKCGGNFGMIIPLSFCCGERINSLRQMTKDKLESIYISNYEIFPSKLFEGAFQRLSITLGIHNSIRNRELYVSKLHRWYSKEREHLIDLIEYTNTNTDGNEFLPLFGKYQSPLHLGIVSKLEVNNKKLSNFVLKIVSKYFIYYQEATNYWMKASARIPYFKKNGIIEKPGHGRMLYFNNQNDVINILAIINSSLFYLWYVTYSDGFHLSDFLLKSFPINENIMKAEKIIEIGKRLENDVKKHAIITTRNTKKDDIEMESFKIVYSKPIIDEIDKVLAKHYGFTEEELDFIINYDIKYRMGSELEGEG